MALIGFFTQLLVRSIAHENFEFRNCSSYSTVVQLYESNRGKGQFEHPLAAFNFQVVPRFRALGSRRNAEQLTSVNGAVLDMDPSSTLQGCSRPMMLKEYQRCLLVSVARANGAVATSLGSAVPSTGIGGGGADTSLVRRLPALLAMSSCQCEMCNRRWQRGKGTEGK